MSNRLPKTGIPTFQGFSDMNVGRFKGITFHHHLFFTNVVQNNLVTNSEY
jgi:hypothetical protein